METLKQVTKDVDVVKIAEINPKYTLCKKKFYVQVSNDHEETKKLKWEAMMLVTKANEHLMMNELKLKKRELHMTNEERFKIQEDFFNRFLRDMDDVKADRIAQLLEVMVISKGGDIDENVSVS